MIQEGDYEFYPFYNNFNTLTDAIAKDSAKIIVMPFALHPHPHYVSNYDKYSEYTNTVALNNTLMKQIADEKKLEWLPYEHSMIDSLHWFDECHLLAPGEKLKAAIVADRIFSVMKASAP